jgi:IS5 family transposase
MGRPAKPTRLMVGLHYLKHTFDLSDEEVVTQWVENPYWQYFCGVKNFQHEFPIDPSLMTKWRNRIESKGLENLLEETIRVGFKTGTVKRVSVKKLNVDTTVQEKAISFPTDAKLYHRMRERLVHLSKEIGIKLRQNYNRKSKQSLIMQGRYSHARQMKRSKREIKKIKNYFGRVMRDIERKIAGNAVLVEQFSEVLKMSHRLYNQKRNDKNKLYALHAPEVECISKGKAHKKYEFGCKVGIVTTSKDNFVIGAMAFHGNPYDGHTLKESISQAERLGHFSAQEIYVDKGYRKHNYEGSAVVELARGGMKKVKRSLRKWLKRRSAIEPVIGHMKNDGRLGRNYLKGVEGDKMNAVLCGAGHNMRKLLAAFLFFLFGWQVQTDLSVKN